LSSTVKYGATEKAAIIPNKKDRKTDTVTVYLPANLLYPGLAALTMLVITVEQAIRIKIVLVIFFYRLRDKFYCVITYKKNKYSCILGVGECSFKAKNLKRGHF
jgi:hypothetical protein